MADLDTTPGSREGDSFDPDADSSIEDGWGLKYPADHSIPKALYIKAQNHQDQLTQEERQILLSRGDLVGKALGHPESLTIGEMHEVMSWPSPEVVHTNIQRATGGTLSTPFDLYAKGEDALARGQIRDFLSDEEIALIRLHFHSVDDTDVNPIGLGSALARPGASQAATLTARRMGLEFRVWHAALYQKTGQKHPDYRKLMQPAQPASTVPSNFSRVMPPSMQGPESATVPSLNGQPRRHSDILRAKMDLAEQFKLGKVTADEFAARNEQYGVALRVSNTDLYGTKDWPPIGIRRSPIDLFGDELRLSAFDAEPMWYTLPEDEKEPYRAQSETRRREAWADYEGNGQRTTTLQAEENLRRQFSLGNVTEEEFLVQAKSYEAARQAEYVDTHGSDDWPPAGNKRSAIEIFANEMSLSGFDANSIWHTISDDNKEVYRAQAERLRREAWAEHYRGPLGENTRPIDIAHAMYFIDEERRLGNITVEEAEARNMAYLEVLRAAQPAAVFHHFEGPRYDDPYPMPPIPLPSPSDQWGIDNWPPGSNRYSPVRLFAEETNLWGWHVVPGWFALPENLKEAYRARCETLRREALTEYEKAQSEGTPFYSPFMNQRLQYPTNPFPPERMGQSIPNIPETSSTISGFMVFCDELEGMELDEKFERWNALTEEQKRPYNERAPAKHAALVAAYNNAYANKSEDED
jgi:hypothetical protein